MPDVQGAGWARISCLHWTGLVSGSQIVCNAIWHRPGFDPAPVVARIQEAYTIADQATTAPPLIADVLETGA